MTKIKLIYLAKNVDRQFNGLFNAMGIQGMREQYQIKLQDAIKDINNIDEIINIIKNIKDENNIITSNSAFIINIDNKTYFLDSNITLIDDDIFHKRNFTSYIKFDNSNVDINIELNRINDKIKCLNSEECIEFIKNYITNPPKQYKQISNKPNKIFLYHSYNEEPKEFLIK